MSSIGGFPKPGGGSSGGLQDGNYGDIVVSGGGSSMAVAGASDFGKDLWGAQDAFAAREAMGVVQVNTDPVNRIVSGGGVLWESGFTFRVAAAVYYINGTLYSSPEQTVTLNAADGSNPRIDVIVLDTTGTLGKITGVPASTANEPDIDPTQQIKVTFVLVEAAASAPANLSTASIYSENTEWVSSTSGTGFNANSTTNPYTGTKCIEGSDVATNAYVQLTNGSVVTLGTEAALVFFIRSKASWGKNRALRVQWFNGTVAVGQAVTLADGIWGFDSSVTASYQLIAIPLSQFGGAAGQAVDALRITCARGTMGFHIDAVSLQDGGGSVGAPQVSYLTQEEADARYQPIFGRSSTLGGTTYTLVLNDTGRYLRATNGAGCAITVPPNGEAPFPIDTVVSIRAATAGTVSLAAGSGVTLNPPGGSGGSLNFAEEGAVVQIKKVGVNEWDVIGGTAAA